MLQRTKTQPQQKNLFEAILARRSVRSYTDEVLGRDTVHTLLEAAIHAPTAMQEEQWTFVVVQDRQLLKQLSDHAKPLFVEEVRHRNLKGTNHSFEHYTKTDFDIFHGASTLILICARQVSPFITADCWMAAENLMLAATAMGLGSCVIGSAVAALNIYKVKSDLGIPHEYSVIAPIIVGYPAEETPATTRKAPRILSWKQ